MAKLTQDEARKLYEDGILTAKAVRAMEEKGMIARPKNRERFYLATADGQYVIPTLSFTGAKGVVKSESMTKFKTAFEGLLKTHGISEHDIVKPTENEEPSDDSSPTVEGVAND